MEIQQVSWSWKVARANKGFCFFLDLNVVMSFPPKTPSGLTSYKSNYNIGQDRNSQMETVLVLLSSVNMLKLKFLLIFLLTELAVQVYIEVVDKKQRKNSHLLL